MNHLSAHWLAITPSSTASGVVLRLNAYFRIPSRPVPASDACCELNRAAACNPGTASSFATQDGDWLCAPRVYPHCCGQRYCSATAAAAPLPPSIQLTLLLLYAGRIVPHHDLFATPASRAICRLVDPPCLQDVTASVDAMPVPRSCSGCEVPATTTSGAGSGASRRIRTTWQPRCLTLSATCTSSCCLRPSTTSCRRQASPGPTSSFGRQARGWAHCRACNCSKRATSASASCATSATYSLTTTRSCRRSCSSGTRSTGGTCR